MQQFDICLRSFAEVQDFVSLATVQPFQVMVGNDHQQVNAKSFMGMLSLDFSRPIQVKADCSSEVFNRFRLAVLGAAK